MQLEKYESFSNKLDEGLGTRLIGRLAMRNKFIRRKTVGFMLDKTEKLKKFYEAKGDRKKVREIEKQIKKIKRRWGV